MYRCTWCGLIFHEEDAAVKTTCIRIHGENETEDIDVCPYCHSEEIVEVEEEEDDNEQ